MINFLQNEREKIMEKQKKNKFNRRKLINSMALAGITFPIIGRENVSAQETKGIMRSNALLWAIAWKETAAEYGALCHQAFNIARWKVDSAVAKRKSSDKPLAIISDMDNTIIGATSYWGYLINQQKEFFDDAIWDKWVPKNLISAIPGAKRFLDHCYDKNVEVFYVTNRNQGENTYQYALDQLQYLKFPYADEQHLTVYRESSNKMPSKKAISESHELVLILGDNLNDYKRDYYVKDVDERFDIMSDDRDDYGDKFIILPNPTDGHWVRAMFGTSEPEPNDENLMILQNFATRNAWDGK